MRRWMRVNNVVELAYDREGFGCCVNGPKWPVKGNKKDYWNVIDDIIRYYILMNYNRLSIKL